MLKLSARTCEYNTRAGDPCLNATRSGLRNVVTTRILGSSVTENPLARRQRATYRLTSSCLPIRNPCVLGHTCEICPKCAGRWHVAQVPEFSGRPLVLLTSVETPPERTAMAFRKSPPESFISPKASQRCPWGNPEPDEDRLHRELRKDVAS